MEDEIEVFIAFNSEDIALLKELKNHLKPLEIQGLITVWDASKIVGGTDWKQAINDHLKTASIILLLVSSNFMASTEAYDLAKKAVAKNAPPSVYVVPVLLYEVDWEYSVFGILAPLPANRKPIDSWPNRNAAYFDVIKGIRGIIAELKTLSVSSQSSSQITVARSTLVNRNEELQTVQGALDTLLDSKRVLRTPIIQFYGVNGIGKTILLKEVLQRCHSRGLKSIWLDKDKIKNTYTDFILPTQELLKEEKKGVVIVDTIDDLRDQQLQEFEEGLRDLIDNSFLFVVLASRSIMKFDTNRSVARKLTSFHLQPLRELDCQKYCNKFLGLRPEFRDVIYEWTNGYPLAMDVMATAIIEQDLDPNKVQDKLALLSILNEKVIYQRLLAKANSNDITRLETLLTLLSVPRRFNLSIMKDIVEKFVPRYKLDSTLGYIALPEEINSTAAVLNWSLSRAGYCIDDPIRNLFLLKLKHEDLKIEYGESHTYKEIHRFLAAMNKTIAGEISGPDHIRYLEEWFYHLAESGEPAYNIVQNITEVVKQLAEKHHEDLLLQFYEEFKQDQNLHDALGNSAQNVNELLSRYLRI